MALAVTAKYEEFILEIEWVASSGTYVPVCGLIDVTISRTASLDTSEIPDCDDESLPLSIEKSVRSVEVTISGTGSWAQSSAGYMLDWFYSSATKNVRLRNTKAGSGDTKIESGPALLTNYSNARAKGQKVSAEIEIVFDGTPSRTDA